MPRSRSHHPRPRPCHTVPRLRCASRRSAAPRPQIGSVSGASREADTPDKQPQGLTWVSKKSPGSPQGGLTRYSQRIHNSGSDKQMFGAE